MLLPMRILTIVTAIVLVTGVTACGSSKSSSNGYKAPATNTTTAAPATTTTTTAAPATAGSGETVKLSADPSGQLAFSTTTLSAKAGKVTVDLTNPAPVPHAIAIEGNGVDKDGPTVTTGGHSTVTLTLKPGTYSFYCPVPGHKAAGMTGTLKVT